MYVFYGDESGFSKGAELEAEQPITVYAGILVNYTKLNKAITVYDEILANINEGIEGKIKELKFNDIKQTKYPYSINYKSVDKKCDLIENIVAQFQKDISFKIFYSAICDEFFFDQKRSGSSYINKLTHPYLAASYRVISRIEHYLQAQKNNKGKTFIILDQQDKFQDKLENLIVSPLHIPKFTQIIDTAYFGKSHHSKLIQISDLIAGIIRHNYCCIHTERNKKHFDLRIEKIFESIKANALSKECFPKGDLRTLYSIIEK